MRRYYIGMHIEYYVNGMVRHIVHKKTRRVRVSAEHQKQTSKNED